VAQILYHNGDGARQTEFFFRTNYVFICHIWNIGEVLVSRFRTFYDQKHDLSDKKNPSVTRRCRCWINLCHAYSHPLES
jgi:hypothetical protein